MFCKIHTLVNCIEPLSGLLINLRWTTIGRWSGGPTIAPWSLVTWRWCSRAREARLTGIATLKRDWKSGYFFMKQKSQWGKNPLFIQKFPWFWCFKNVNFVKNEIFRNVNSVKIEIFRKVNFVKIEISKMWILWKLRFQTCEFCQKLSFSKCEFCGNWDFKNVNFVNNDI